MADGPYPVRRVNPRFSFFADAEVTLRDGTGVRAQLAELSSRGCYIDALEPIPSHTKLHLRICDGINTCELHGKVLYLHSGGALEFSAWAWCLKRWVLTSSPQLRRGCAGSLGVLAKTQRRTPFLKPEAKSHRTNLPSCIPDLLINNPTYVHDLDCHAITLLNHSECVS